MKTEMDSCLEPDNGQLVMNTERSISSQGKDNIQKLINEKL